MDSLEHILRRLGSRFYFSPGEINGGVHSDFIEFDFHGNDEMEEAFGEGEATLEGNRLTLILRYYRGDEFTFYCERCETPADPETRI